MQDFKIPTNNGKKTINEIFEHLAYSSYESNRDEGLTHDQLLTIGLGNDKFKERYDNKLKERQ